jgi:bifunctional non-homologous end joining protein LigD
MSLAARSPGEYVATMSKAQRRGKVFIDYLRNQRGATAIASYVTRAREGAPVATPLAWNEVTARLKPERWNVQTLPKRLAGGNDPWEDFFAVRQRLTAQICSAASGVLVEVTQSGKK